MSTLQPESQQYINRMIESWDVNKTQIANDIIELFGEEWSLETVRGRVRRYIRSIGSETHRIRWEMEEAVETLNKEIEPEKKKYELIEDWGRYYFFVRTKKVDRYWQEQSIPHKLPIEDYDWTGSCVMDICYDFAQEWWDMTQLEVRKKHNLSPELWNKIKSAIPLYKISDPTPDVIWKILRDQGWEERIDEFIEELWEKSIEKYKNRLKRVEQRKREQDYRKGIDILHNRQNRMEYLKEAIKDMPATPAPKIIEHESATDWRLTVAFADLHIWECTSDVIKNIQEMVKYIVKQPEKNIDLVCLWDLVETVVSWGMHIWQIEKMDNIYGFKLIKEAVKNLGRMITTLEANGKNVSFKWLWGNHDRLGKSHHDDPDRSWALIIYEMLLLSLQNLKAEVTYYQEKVNTLIIGKVEYVLTHWEDWLSQRAEKRPTEVLWENSTKSTPYQLVLTGHLHNINMSNPSKGAHVVRLPALHPGGSYGKQINKSSDAGFLVVRDEDWLEFNLKYLD